MDVARLRDIGLPLCQTRLILQRRVHVSCTFPCKTQATRSAAERDSQTQLPSGCTDVKRRSQRLEVPSDVADWDAAFDTRSHVPGIAEYPGKWSREATSFRERMSAAGRAQLKEKYGSRPREMFDLFLPEEVPQGLVVFVHGGYWRSFANSYFSHLAAGPVSRGWAMALPSYMLAPKAHISEITSQVARALTAVAALVDGPILLVGHSAGGHLVTRMLCDDVDLPPEVWSRITRVVSISGVHDLRPLLRTAINDDLRLDNAEAVGESPALCAPRANVELVCWVGSAERPEFIRQTDLLVDSWRMMGVETRAYHAPGEHHFSVVEPLAIAESDLCKALFETWNAVPQNPEV